MYQTIGIVTGGGDAPGLNAVIRAAVKTAVGEYGMRVIGIEDSFEGLLGKTITRELKPADVRGLLPRGGSLAWDRRTGAAPIGVPLGAAKQGRGEGQPTHLGGVVGDLVEAV